MDNITANEVAGLGVGALLLCATLAAPKIDVFISSSQRRSLGMCNRCGDLKLIACKSCRGAGSFQTGGLFSGLGDNPSPRRDPCTKCRSRGHFPCPECSSSVSAN
ncbi:hypothetical protein V2J09_005603 [Rumex salicifolius]